MKHWKKSLLAGMACLTAAIAKTSCNGIDDDLSDCGADVELTYRMRLITNMETEIDSVLSEAGDQPVANQLRQTMRQYFNDQGHDLDLSFYNLMDGMRLKQFDQNMNGQTQATYTIYLEQADYRHTAVANFRQNGIAQWLSPETLRLAALQNSRTDTIDSHQTGIFTGRHAFKVESDDKLSGLVDLYMANSAAAVVIDTLGSSVRGMKAFIEGLSNGFLTADSTYTFSQQQVVRTQLLPVTAGTEVCYYGMGFPSSETPYTRVTPSEAKEGSFWSMVLLVQMPDGSVTRNDLYIHEPLRAANLKIIKLKLKDDGSVETVDVEVSVSVQLNWEDGLHFEW